MNKLFLGTGTFYKLRMTLKDQRILIDNSGLRKYLDGLELCMANQSEMTEIEEDKDHINFLQSFRSNIVHAPFKKFFVTKENYELLFKRIISFAELVKAKHVVWHLYNVESVELLKKFNYPFTIENTLTGDWNGEKIIDVFKKNNLLNMTLDTSHAYHFGRDEFNLLTSKLKNHINHIHLSNIIDGVHHLQFFLEQKNGIALTEMLEKFPRKKDFIITIEENFNNTEHIFLEVKYVYKRLKEWEKME
ncbi:MAG: hypothetical protein ACMXX9_00400 [Candidatus Woesearchaeota archaeon]